MIGVSQGPELDDEGDHVLVRCLHVDDDVVSQSIRTSALLTYIALEDCEKREECS